jgi:hypothetical protein
LISDLPGLTRPRPGDDDKVIALEKSSKSIAPQLRCREIGEADLDPIIDLLTAGYQISNRDFWIRRIERLSRYPAPVGFPKYGYLLDYQGAPVGVIFTIFSSYIANKMTKIRCYLANWYVDPQYRSYAIMLAARAVRNKGVTYRIGTPIQHVLPVLEALGYRRFCGGRFVSVPALSWRSQRARVRLFEPNARANDDLTFSEIKVLQEHIPYGCISVTCVAEGRTYPFVFHPRRKAGILPFARLIYCRQFEDFVRFSGPLGRFLLTRGFPLVVLDTNGPVPGLVGKFSSKFPKYFKGEDPPRLEDSAYSARVVFDF